MYKKTTTYLICLLATSSAPLKLSCLHPNKIVHNKRIDKKSYKKHKRQTRAKWMLFITGIVLISLYFVHKVYSKRTNTKDLNLTIFLYHRSFLKFKHITVQENATMGYTIHVACRAFDLENQENKILLFVTNKENCQLKPEKKLAYYQIKNQDSLYMYADAYYDLD